MTTLDYQVSAGADDGYTGLSAGFQATDVNVRIGRENSGVYTVWARWTGVTIPVGATITSAYISFSFHGSYGTPPACTLYFEDAANPAAPTSRADIVGRTKTTNNVSITGPTSGTWWNSSDISAIITELITSYNYSSGSAMQMIIVGGGDSSWNYSQAHTYEETGNVSGPKLHIEYTPLATGSAGITGPGLCSISPLVGAPTLIG